MSVSAVIFDIDGTLADVTHRREHLLSKPKDWKSWNAKAPHDTPKPSIVRLLKTLSADSKIIITTGREDQFKETTKHWLWQHGIHHDLMLMRKTKDYRADDVIKAEMFDKIMYHGYMPWLVIDDRDRVVAMWREKGLTCLQCAPGDF